MPGILALITVVNLRGTRESGLAVRAPDLPVHRQPGRHPRLGCCQGRGWLADTRSRSCRRRPAGAAEAAGALALLRAFASGCTAMTGVEAVSNGVSAFREPTVRNAHGTLTVIVVVLGVLLLGIGQIAYAYGIGAMDQTKEGYQSVLSQVVGAVDGRGWLYYVTIGSVLAVLCLSANTSFVGFPRLCHLVAADGFLPRPFAVAGRRLVYSVGILFLAIGSGGLLAAFGGITDRLIPLFAVGAFLSFTLSQAGMAVHWWHALGKVGAPNGKGRRRVRGGRSGHHARLLINGGGAIATGAALAIILLAKFVEGAWLTVIVIPCTLGVLRAVHRYYGDLDRHVLQGSHRRINARDHTPPVTIVPIARWDRLSRKAVEYALRLSPDVMALHVTTLEGPEADHEEQRLRREWREFVQQPATDAGLQPPKLLLVPSQYRSVVAPLLRAIQIARARLPGRPVMIVLPELVEGRWWGDPTAHASRTAAPRTSAALRRTGCHRGVRALAVACRGTGAGAGGGEGIAAQCMSARAESGNVTLLLVVYQAASGGRGRTLDDQPFTQSLHLGDLERLEHEGGVA